MATVIIRKYQSIERSYEFELTHIEHKEIKTKRKNPKAIMKEILYKLISQKYLNNNFEITYSAKYNNITIYEDFKDVFDQNKTITEMTIYELEEEIPKNLERGLHSNENC